MVHMPEQTEVIFLGFTERASLVQDGNTPFSKWNIIGLKSILISPIVPMTLAGLKVALASRLGLETEFELRIKSEAGEQIGWLRINLAPSQIGNGAAVGASSDQTMLVDPEGWMPFMVPIETPIFVLHPGRHRLVKVQADGSESFVGSFVIGLADAVPLDADRIAAIRSDPLASKAVRIELGCTKCETKVRAFAALDKSQQSDGYVWYADLPDEITCSCRITTFDLRSIKKNLHGLLGHPMSSAASQANLSPLYEHGAIENVRRKFVQLLDRKPAEEVLQRFIQDNPILLHQFPAERLFFKPAILTHFKADFAVLTPQKELILIEIENTKTRIMNKNGDAAAPLGHSLDQVRNWLHVVDEHRLAALEALGLDRVSSVRGVVIAGRDKPYNADHMRRFKGVDRGRISFFTFDDLALSLASLGERVSKL